MSNDHSLEKPRRRDLQSFLPNGTLSDTGTIPVVEISGRGLEFRSSHLWLCVPSYLYGIFFGWGWELERACDGALHDTFGKAPKPD